MIPTQPSVPLHQQEMADRVRAKELAKETAKARRPVSPTKTSLCNGFRSVTSIFEVPISIVATGMGTLLGTAGGAIYKCGARALGKETKPIRHYSVKIASLGQKAGTVLGRIVGAPLAVAIMPLTVPGFYIAERVRYVTYKRELEDSFFHQGRTYTGDHIATKPPCKTVAQVLDEKLYTPLFGLRRLLEERPAVASATPLLEESPAVDSTTQQERLLRCVRLAEAMARLLAPLQPAFVPDPSSYETACESPPPYEVTSAPPSYETACESPPPYEVTSAPPSYETGYEPPPPYEEAPA